MTDDLGSYADLLARADGAAGTTWGLLPPELGTIGLLTPRRVADAAALVRTGETFRLDHPLTAFATPIARHRTAPTRIAFSTGPDQRDDYLDSFYLQASTQIDGLRHLRDHELGHYGGLAPDQVDEGPALGIEAWAEHGITGRGVLVDVPRYLARTGLRPLDHRSGQRIDVALLEQTLADQEVERRDGDLLVIRTGWQTFYFDELTDIERAEFPEQLACAGLEQSHEMLAWLWDTRVAVAAADNPTVECYPPVADSPFNRGLPPGTGIREGMAHSYLIARLGLALGELWRVDALAERCDADSRYDFLLVANVLNLPGGVGSPANAVAIR